MKPVGGSNWRCLAVLAARLLLDSVSSTRGRVRRRGLIVVAITSSLEMDAGDLLSPFHQLLLSLVGSTTRLWLRPRLPHAQMRWWIRLTLLGREVPAHTLEVAHQC